MHLREHGLAQAALVMRRGADERSVSAICGRHLHKEALMKHHGELEPECGGELLDQLDLLLGLHALRHVFICGVIPRRDELRREENAREDTPGAWWTAGTRVQKAMTRSPTYCGTVRWWRKPRTDSSLLLRARADSSMCDRADADAPKKKVCKQRPITMTTASKAACGRAGEVGGRAQQVGDGREMRGRWEGDGREHAAEHPS